MAIDFTRAKHTLVLSDIHLSEAEPAHPHNPLWKRYKRAKYFVDRTFKAWLEEFEQKIGEPTELIFNGDIFDFDSVMSIPEKPPYSVTWLERKRGLHATEEKSRYKISIILRDHHLFVSALTDFIKRGHRVVFVIGNHDMELHWPSVQADIIEALNLGENERQRIRFCEWFYVSNGDTLIEHSNQYDAYCLSNNPIQPLIKKRGQLHVRLPFGNLAGRFMLNGIGLMNPHVDSSFIKSSLWEYIVFFYKYVLSVQPLLPWTWFWGAMVTLFYSLAEGLLPAVRDPLMTELRIENIARKANSSSAVVRGLRELHAHPAIFDPIKILRELWLDRALILFGIFLGSFWFFSSLKVFFPSISIYYFVVPIGLLTPAFVFYARSIETEVFALQKAAMKAVPVSAQIANVARVVHGHTHLETHNWIQGIEHINTGTWSAAYRDVACTEPYGRKGFAWIKPGPKNERIAELYEWKENKSEIIIPVG